jgi:hypothetical protein
MFKSIGNMVIANRGFLGARKDARAPRNPQSFQLLRGVQPIDLFLVPFDHDAAFDFERGRQFSAFDRQLAGEQQNRFDLLVL